MRKLASIQKIESLDPIPGADAIEKARVLGWSLVVKKGEFRVGDPCVYFEIDSILPERPEFEFLRSRGFRIKTIKLKGQVSQGLAFPVSILGDNTFNVGDDVTDILGVTKYEPVIPAQLSGLVKGTFPPFIPKTDETRIQACPEVLVRHRGKTFAVTEKVDGSSMTVYIKDGVFGVCSRRLELKEDDQNSFWKAARKYRIEEALRGTGNWAIQGELLGPGIQKNKYGFKDIELRVFNVYDIDNGRYLNHGDMKRFTAACNLKTVPILNESFMLMNSVDELVEIAKGNSEEKSDVKREGLVFRPLAEEIDEDLGRLSFKVLNVDFLLKHNE